MEQDLESSATSDLRSGRSHHDAASFTLEEEQELWSSWTAHKEASIVLDGKGLHEVFSAVKRQLDMLRKRQSRFQDELDNVADDVAEKLLIANASADTSEFVKYSDIELVMAAVEQMKNDSKLIRELDRKMASMETILVDKTNDLERRIEQLVLQNNDQKLNMMQQESRLSMLENTWTNKFNSFLKNFDEKTENLEVTQMVNMKEVDDKITLVRDTVTVQDIRAKQFETRISQNSEQIGEVHHSLTSLIKRDIESINTNIAELFDNKAEREELEQKASIEALESRATVFELKEIKATSEELDRKLFGLTQETADRFNGMDSKLDRRSDRIVTWCLKQLRKELKSMQIPDDGPKEGTDIGKVRCLVCDHVSTQQRETEIVHSGPGLKNTMRSHHKKERSPSPPNGGRSPDRLPETNTTPTNHSRFVKLSGAPEINYDDNEDPDYADFKFRGTTKLPPAVTGNSSSGLPNSQSAPLIQIISHHPTDASHQRLSQLPFHQVQQQHQHQQIQQQQQQQVLNYYKDMEQKFSGKNAVAANQGVKQADFKRPGSAPMKRSNTTSKLLPMGKLVS